MRYLLLCCLFVFTSCAVNQVAPPVKDNRIKYVKKKSPKAHSIKLIVKDERKDKVHSEKVKSFIGKIYAKQLKEFGHKISNSSTNQVIVYIKSYSSLHYQEAYVQQMPSLDTATHMVKE
jgi:hypothetical protein